MPIDLHTSSLIVRNGLVLDDHCLVILEPEVSKSRIWRVPFEQVRKLTVSRQLPIARMIVVFTLIMLPGILLAVLPEDGVWILGGSLIAISLAILIYYAVCGITTFNLEYGQRKRVFKVIARPKKINRFLNRLTASVEATHDHHRQRYAELEEDSPAR